MRSVRTKKPAPTRAEGMGRPTPAGGEGRLRSTCDSKLAQRPPAESVPPIPGAIFEDEHHRRHYEKVTALVRRPISIKHPKLNVIYVDFRQLEGSFPNESKRKGRSDLFSMKSMMCL